jgi:hypothetical protein
LIERAMLLGGQGSGDSVAGSRTSLFDHIIGASIVANQNVTPMRTPRRQTMRHLFLVDP